MRRFCFWLKVFSKNYSILLLTASPPGGFVLRIETTPQSEWYEIACRELLEFAHFLTEMKRILGEIMAIPSISLKRCQDNPLDYKWMRIITGQRCNVAIPMPINTAFRL